MRYFLEEKLDDCKDIVKSYINKIKDFTEDELIQEFCKQHKHLYNLPDESYISIREWHEIQEAENNLDLIARCVEERFYVFRDAEDHSENKKIIKQIIDNII